MGIVLVLGALTAVAHDTWLVPQAFAPAPDSVVVLRLATSEAFPTSDSAVAPDRIEKFYSRTRAGKRIIRGYKAEGKYLVAEIETPQRAGLMMVVAETKTKAFVLEPKIFNPYLQEEEQKNTIEARAKAGKTNAPGRERYRKIAKTALCVGGSAKDEWYSKPEGLWLEIVPERSPCGLQVGNEMKVQVLFEGKPLSGAHLAAGYKGPTGHKYPVWVETDRGGRATVKLDRAGAWYVRVLHMVAAVKDPDADWQSAFSTMTFAVGEKK